MLRTKKWFELEKIKKQSQVVFIGTDKQIYQPDQESKPTCRKHFESPLENWKDQAADDRVAMLPSIAIMEIFQPISTKHKKYATKQFGLKRYLAAALVWNFNLERLKQLTFIWYMTHNNDVIGHVMVAKIALGFCRNWQKISKWPFRFFLQKAFLSD